MDLTSSLISKVTRATSAVLVVAAMSLMVPAKAGAVDDPNRLTVYAGVNLYPNPAYDSVTLLEFPFSIKRHECEFFAADSLATAYEGRVFAKVDLFDVSGQRVDSTNTYFSLRAPSLEAAADHRMRIFNRLTLLEKPGVYSARVTVTDVVSKRKGDYFIDQIAVPPANRDRLAVTQAQMAYHIRYVGDSAAAQPHLVKSGYEVLPNPKSIYGTEDSVVFIYAEAYNLDEPQSTGADFLLSLEVLSQDSSLFVPLGSRLRPKPGASVVIAESFPIAGWLPGLYYVKLTVAEADGSSPASSLTPFRIVSAEELRQKLLAAGGLDPYDTLSLQQKIQLVTYMLTPDERQAIDRLNDQGKLNFLQQYWREHDADPSTEVNETRMEMIRRFELCNRLFSTNAERDNGWLTDRARIYMTLGQYDQIDDRQAPLVEGPFQIWYYNHIQQGRFYIFQDTKGDSDYRLVHSNDPANIYSKEWQARIDYGEIELIQ